MTHPRNTHFLTLLLVLVVGSCGGDSDDIESSEHFSRCESACTPPSSGGCAGEDEASCQSDCVGQADGLSATCVQCLVENSYWDGCSCYCEGDNCTLCCSGGCLSPQTGDTCDASEESCSGFRLGSITDDCAEFCAE